MAIDRDGLHVLLWMRAHKARHTVRVNQSELARELQTSRFTMSRVMSSMVEEGRLVPLGQTYHNTMYRVTDPLERMRQDAVDVLRAADGADPLDP